MTQEFYRTTLVSKFIKYLLSYTPLPVYKLIFDNEDMVAGNLYTYKDKVLKCTKSGRFLGIDGTSGVVDHLRVQDPLRVSDPFFAKTGLDNQYKSDWKKYAPDNGSLSDGWMTVMHPDTGEGMYAAETRPLAVTDDVVGVNVHTTADFDIVDSFLPGEYKPGVTQKYTSNVSYYDPDTHKWLGEYLRYLSNMYDLDLMPLYNCFTYKTVQSLQLQRTGNSKVAEVDTTKYKVMLVPIKYGKTYTIALDSEFPVFMKALFYNDSLVKDPSNQFYLSDYIDEPLIVHNSMQFSQPITYTLTNEQLKSTDNSVNLYRYEKYLYLAIQVPVNNDSSVVVLEGDYSMNGNNSIADVYGLSQDSALQLSKMMVSKISLLSSNDRKQHPFSDKLIQYLLRNTIDNREYIDDNVANVEKKIGYYPEYQGQWDSTLRYILFSKYMNIKNHDELNYKDILGYVDNDIENAVRKGYIVNAR